MIYLDDASSATSICINRWYHVAFVYDYLTSTQALYLNGILEHSRASNPYQGTLGDIVIGAINNGPGNMVYFTGYIDEVALMTRSKSADEILMDATLVCYYTFDFSLYKDVGPLNLPASGKGSLSNNPLGRINSALVFNAFGSYFLVGRLTRLGTSGQAYSIALWIKPSSVNSGTIVHVSKCNTNCTSNWCLAFIGFTSTGRIAIQSWSSVYNNSLVALTGPFISINVWTHIVQTYSVTNGMRLYVNGILSNQSRIFIYRASGAPNYLYLGSFPVAVCVSSNTISMGQYQGSIDEFRLYARELTGTETDTLANP